MATISKPVSTGPDAAKPHRNVLLAWLSAVLLVVGLAAGFFVGQASKADLPSDLASTSTTQLLDDYAKAFNAGDATKLASLLATDATFTDTTKVGGYVKEGNTNIANTMVGFQQQGFRVTETGTAVEDGGFVARYSEPNAGEPGMAVYQIKNGKIQNVWIVKP